MARVEISEVVLRKTTGSNQPSIVPGASVQVNVRGSGAATVYLSSSGGTTVSNPLTADSAGRIEGWLEEGSYDLVVSGSGIATYTLRWEAVSGNNVPALAPSTTARNTITAAASGVTPLTVRSAVESSRRITFSVRGTQETGGTAGLVILRDAVGVASGIEFWSDEDDTDAAWFHGLDIASTDYVLAYDPSAPWASGPGADVLRMKKGGFLLLGQVVGQPDSTRRFEISSSDAQDTAQTALHISFGAASPGTKAIQFQNAGTDVGNVLKTGKAGFGANYGGWIAASSLEAKDAATVVSTTTPRWSLVYDAGTDQHWAITVLGSTASGEFAVEDITTGRFPLKIEKNTPTDTLILAASGTTYYTTLYGTKVTATNGFVTHHVGAATPTGGDSGHIKVGNGKIWVNDAGTWKSVAIA